MHFERPTKQVLMIDGTLVDASSNLISPQSKIYFLVAGVRDKVWSSKSHQRSSVTSLAYLRSVVHFCA